VFLGSRNEIERKFNLLRVCQEEKSQILIENDESESVKKFYGLKNIFIIFFKIIFSFKKNLMSEKLFDLKENF
jgi:hypothetical protein